jgi:hypothetical protein
MVNTKKNGGPLIYTKKGGQLGHRPAAIRRRLHTKLDEPECGRMFVVAQTRPTELSQVQ